MQLNPDDHVITRKRKKYKFAKFFNNPLCYELADWQPQAADVVEVGAGTGLFCVELASRQPDKKFVALDVKADRLQVGAYEAEQRGLKNISFVRARADQLSEVFSAGSLEQVWLTFSDPFPKPRSAGRRLTHANFLKIYQSILKPAGQLKLKHDDVHFFEWSLEQLVASGWRLDEIKFDLHSETSAAEAYILTTYEQRWLDAERRIGYLVATAPVDESAE